MAPAKRPQKRQVAAKPAPAKKSVPAVKKLTRKEKSVINKATHIQIKADARAAVKAFKVARAAKLDAPVKRTVELRAGRAGQPLIEYTPSLAAQLFECVSSGLSLDKIARIEGMPSLSTLLKWIGNPEHKFSEDYLKAKDLLVPLFEERALDAALEPLEYEVVTTRISDRDGTTREVRKVDAVDRAKLMFAAYQWSLSHLRPKKHGRMAVDLSTPGSDALGELLDQFRNRSKEIEPTDG